MGAPFLKRTGEALFRKTRTYHLNLKVETQGKVSLLAGLITQVIPTVSQR